ncbi:MAG: mycothiol transferase [Actinomycetota bacterium]
MADPTIAAARDLLRESLDELREAVAGCSADQLNARPAGDDTNGLAVLVTHALSSTRSWLSLATGVDLPPRDRPAEFRVVVDDPDALLAWFDATAADCRTRLDIEAAFDPAMTGVPSWKYDEADEGNEDPVTAAWALLHALAHLREHVGHAQLTRQVV